MRYAHHLWMRQNQGRPYHRRQTSCMDGRTPGSKIIRASISPASPSFFLPPPTVTPARSVTRVGIPNHGLQDQDVQVPAHLLRCAEARGKICLLGSTLLSFLRTSDQQRMREARRNVRMRRARSTATLPMHGICVWVVEELVVTSDARSRAWIDCREPVLMCSLWYLLVC